VTIIEIIYLKDKSLRSPKSSIIPALLGGAYILGHKKTPIFL